MAVMIRLTRSTAIVLTALLEQTDWQYGYEISRITGVKSGTLYPILIRLDDTGWLRARWDQSVPGKPARHMYRLTATGKVAAEQALTGRQASERWDLAFDKR